MIYEYHNQQLGVTASTLIEDLNVLSSSTLRQWCVRKKIIKLRRACYSVPALVKWDSLPMHIQEACVEAYGQPEEITNKIVFEDYLIDDQKAIEYYQNYELADGSRLPEEKQKEYATNAMFLNTCDYLLKDIRARQKAFGIRGTKGIWQRMSEVVNNLKSKHKHSLPKNYRDLKARCNALKGKTIKRYPIGGYEGLIHGNYLNENSQKITSEAKLWLLTRWANQVERTSTISHLWEEYNEACEDKGWKKLDCEESIRNYLYQEETKVLWWGHRYGELNAKEKFGYQHKTKMSTMRDSLWYADGTKLNYYYLNEKGQIKTCQVYEVMDAFSEVLLGYHISDTEDYKAQYAAFKMAVQTAGHRPYELKVDNQGGHKRLEAGEFLGKIAKISLKTQPYNGKSKTIESAFGRFQQRYMKKDWFFSGQNITTKKQESKANMEMVLANKDQLPTLSEVKKVYKKRREEWNNAKHSSLEGTRLEVYQNSNNTETPKLELWDMIDLFWVLHSKPITVTPQGITFQVQKTKYRFCKYLENGLPDIEWIGTNIDAKYYLKYDPQDLTQIYLYEDSPQGLRFVTEMTTKVEVHRGRQEQKEGELG